MKKKIFISTTSFGEYDTSYLKTCEDKGFEVVLNPYGRKIKTEELIKLARGAYGLIAGTEPLTGEVLSKLPDLKVISRCGAGLDNIDREAAKRLGIKVCNTPDAPTVAVAELAVGLALNILRRINEMDKALREGKWKKEMGNLLNGQKVGIIGFGRIGRKVAELLKGFGCELAYSDPFTSVGLLGLRSLSKEDLLGWCDGVTIHVSTNERILGKRELELMRKGTWLINTSRPGVLDERALYEMLKSRHLAGAALDVFSEEPYKGELRTLENVILTPHIGSYAKEARINMERQSVENLLNALKEEIQ